MSSAESSVGLRPIAARQEGDFLQYWAVRFLRNTKVEGLLPEFIQRHWRRALRIRERVRFSEEAFHLLLAGGVGVIGGLVYFVFYRATESVGLLFLQRPGEPAEVAEMMQGWQRVLTPALGGLCAGLVLHWGLRMVGPLRSSNLLEVIVAGDGRLPLRSGVVKFVSSLVTIGSGGSIGREGGIVQLAATLASKWGQLAKWPPYRLRLLVGCGAASGIAAAYNAPISGAVFAALIVMGNFSMSLFAPLVFASVVATMVSRSFFGIRPWYTVPPFEFTSLTQLPWFVCLGLLSGAMGAAFMKLLNLSEAAFKRVRAPIYLRLALGGLVVGVIALWFPGVWGNGLRDHKPDFARGLWRASVREVGQRDLGAGGAVSGEAGWRRWRRWGPGQWAGCSRRRCFWARDWGRRLRWRCNSWEAGAELPVTAFALVGMGSMLSATTRSPLLAMIMVFEISLDYSLMPPLMLACVVSMLVARRLHPESIYTEPLRRKGLMVPQEATASEAAAERTVGDLMRAPVPPVRETATLREIADRFLTEREQFPAGGGREGPVGRVWWRCRI